MKIFHRAIKINDTISLSTVYRTMNLLEEMGATHRHAFNFGPSRFEQAHGEHHDHLIGIDTGAVVKFKSDKIEKLQEEIARSLGYDIAHHRLELCCRKTRVRTCQSGRNGLRRFVRIRGAKGTRNVYPFSSPLRRSCCSDGRYRPEAETAASCSIEAFGPGERPPPFTLVRTWSRKVVGLFGRDHAPMNEAAHLSCDPAKRRTRHALHLLAASGAISIILTGPDPKPSQ
jgi:Fur family transcriptional regulator, ferric uptake regulator